MNRFSQEVIIISRNLDGFGESQTIRQIHQTFPLYGIKNTSCILKKIAYGIQAD